MATISIAKVSAAMRKAGLTAAKWNASGQVRGWGDWSSGVRVRLDKFDKVIRVEYVRGHWAKETPEMVEADIAKISAALAAAGIAYNRDREQITVPVTQS